MEWSLTEEWAGISKIAVYGFGRVSKANLGLLLKDFEIEAIIDNKEGLDGNCYKSVPLKNWERFVKENSTVKIVVAATGRALASIESQLNEAGKKKGIDYTDIGTFLGEWYLRFRGKLSIGRVAHSVTQKCTFRCRDCQLLIPYIACPAHMDLESLKKDIRFLFQVADFISDFDVMGGETFLYPDLRRYLDYLVSNHAGQIGNIQIVTNASIVPEPEILEYIREKGIRIRISDYSGEIPYREKVDRFVRVLEEYEIEYDRFADMQWTPFGYPYQERFVSDDCQSLRQHMQRCNGGMSKALYDGKLYYCNTAGGACQNMGYVLEADDYIDLQGAAAGGQDAKIKAWKYCMGILEQGGMKLCGFCRGYADEHVIPAGVQVK